MKDYMRALHQRFCREPDFSELEKILKTPARRCGTAWARCSGAGSCTLWTHRICYERKSPWPGFTAGFKLAWGLSKELEADGLYFFDEEKTERICCRMEKEE